MRAACTASCNGCLRLLLLLYTRCPYSSTARLLLLLCLLLHALAVPHVCCWWHHVLHDHCCWPDLLWREEGLDEAWCAQWPPASDAWVHIL